MSQVAIKCSGDALTLDPWRDTKKVEAYCVSKPDVPLVQAVKTVLGISVGQ